MRINRDLNNYPKHRKPCLKNANNMYYSYILILILFWNSFSSISAQEKTSLAPNRWKTSISISSLYDNNILKYSEKYLDRFEKKQDAGRFHINHADDIILQSKAEISYSYNIIKNNASAISVSADYNRYLNNTIKNWGQVGVGISQEISRPLTFDINYSYIPDFYVRHYRDADWVKEIGYSPEAFKNFSFSKEDLGAVLLFKLDRNTRIRGYFSFLRYIHNKNFTEYDCNNFEYGIRLNRNIFSNFTFDIAYLYTVSRTTRRDEVVNLNNLIEYADASNNEYNINCGISYSLPKLFKKSNAVSLRFQYSRSNYISEIIPEKDPLHSGRIDNDYRLSFKYSIELVNNFSTGILFNWMKRVTDSEHSQNRETISAEKDYDQIQIGLNFAYNLNF